MHAATDPVSKSIELAVTNLKAAIDNKEPFGAQLAIVILRLLLAYGKNPKRFAKGSLLKGVTDTIIQGATIRSWPTLLTVGVPKLDVGYYALFQPLEEIKLGAQTATGLRDTLSDAVAAIRELKADDQGRTPTDLAEAALSELACRQINSQPR